MIGKEDIQKIRHILYRFKARLLHNTTFGKSMRGMAWQPATEADGLKRRYHREYDVFAGHTLNHILDNKVIQRFTREVNAWSRQHDIIWEATGDITIEPKSSLAWLPGRKFILPTRSNAHEYLVPGLVTALKHQHLNRQHTYYESLIHFDGFIGRNLYHFFDESVNAWWLLQQESQLPPDIPLLINEKIHRIPYVQYILSLPELKNLNWVVQREGEWIHTNKLYKAVPSNEFWKHSYRMLDGYVRKNPHRRIFLNRTARFQRRLTNNDAIEAIVKSYGFEVVYAENLSYAEQVQLFAETEYFIGLHGAGVTNLIWADLSRVHVMEIFSESLIHPHFYWFLELLHVNYYDGIVGTPFDINWNYSIDETRFKAQLDRMMTAKETAPARSYNMPKAINMKQ